ncbi:MAG: hypothetical protein U0531_03325 [Dehalococcoidia bacterium]
MTADDHPATPTATAASRPDLPRWRRSLAIISLSVLMASVSFSFWTPFIPAYMKELGAADGAALTWSASALGAGIIASLAHRWDGRGPVRPQEAIFLRALFFAA